VTPSRRVVLWRHGRTAWNAETRFQGTTDVPLDDVGVLQAERAARGHASATAPRCVVTVSGSAMRAPSFHNRSRP